MRAMLDAAPAGGDAITADDIMRYCELIAEASGSNGRRWLRLQTS
jgi:hypothetical protein